MSIIVLIQFIGHMLLCSVSIEIPGGLIDKGESAETAALRELGEETGQTGIIEVCITTGLTMLVWRMCPLEATYSIYFVYMCQTDS